MCKLCATACCLDDTENVYGASGLSADVVLQRQSPCRDGFGARIADLQPAATASRTFQQQLGLQKPHDVVSVVSVVSA